MSRTLVRRATGLVDRPVSRRGFLRRMTMGATALAVTPLFYMSRPVTAYAAKGGSTAEDGDRDHSPFTAAPSSADCTATPNRARAAR